MSKIITCILLLAFIKAQAQSVLNNLVTDKHKRIDGTNIYLIIPDGFAKNAQTGYYESTTLQASILVNQINSSLDAVHQEMSKDNLFAQGSIWIKEEPITIKSYSGFIIKIRRQMDRDKLIVNTLIFGDVKVCYVIQCISSEANQPLVKELKSVLLNAAIKDYVKSNPVPYTLNVKEYRFELTETRANTNIYESTRGGDKSFLQISHFFTKEEMDEEILFHNKMLQLPLQSIHLDENGIVVTTVNTLPGLWANINAVNDRGEPVLVYQLLLKDGNTHFLVQAFCTTSAELNVVQELARTLRKSKYN